MSASLRELVAAHIEWLGCRKSLQGSERRKFERWVARVHPEFLQGMAPVLFRQQCLEVRRGTALPKRGGIGPATLERHAAELLDRYLTLPEDERGTFSSFLERVVAKCRTPRELRRFLKRSQP